MLITPVLWNIVLFLFILGVIIISVLLYRYSKQPMEWKHESLLEKTKQQGRLIDLAASIHLSSPNEATGASLKTMITTIFLEKIRTRNGLSFQDMQIIRDHDPDVLKELIHNTEISEWMHSTAKPSFFRRKASKAQYLNTMKNIVEQMEVWGE